MKLICAVSDTHNMHHLVKVPECDIFIHAGDATARGREYEVRDFAKWMNSIPAKHKIWIPGNHELYFEKELPLSMIWFTEHCKDAHVLINDEIEIDGIKFWGSPITPYFLNWAWNVQRGVAIRRFWDFIPQDTDVLITHGPPYGILDKFHRYGTSSRVGCEQLREVVLQIKPKLHIFGHIHESYGAEQIDKTLFHNVSICGEEYKAVNPVTLIDYSAL